MYHRYQRDNIDPNMTGERTNQKKIEDDLYQACWSNHPFASKDLQNLCIPTVVEGSGA